MNSEIIEIKIPDRVKTSGPNRNQPLLVIPYYQKNKKVCAAYTLECYLKRISKLRGDTESLFISTKRPFKAVSAQTLGHWVKDTLELCGRDTKIFTALSTRHASTSAAKRNGIDIDTLRKTAGCTERSKTFAKFYDLKVSQHKSAFANSILDN